MIMRFYWGLGVGHVYSHGDAYISAMDEEDGEEASDAAPTCEPHPDEAHSNIPDIDHNHTHDDDDHDDENNVDSMAEFGLSDRENDAWASDDDDDEDKDQPGLGSNEVDFVDSGGEEELELDYTYNGHHYHRSD